MSRPDNSVRGITLVFGQQGGGLHELTRLAIATLGHVERNPGLLERVESILAEMLDGGDVAAGDVADRNAAGTHRRAINMDGTTSAQAGAAVEACSSQPKLVAQNPQERSVGGAFDGASSTIDDDFDHVCARDERLAATRSRLSLRTIRGRTRTPDRIVLTN